MDDDDELLLNFAAPDTSSVAASKNQNVKVSGGRWKDRRKLQLALQGRTKKRQLETGVNLIPVDEFKRKRDSEDKVQLTQTKGQTPTSTTKELTYLPSNAPMKDATTFSGLGLNEKLSIHLTDHLRFMHPTKIQQLVIPSLISTENDLFVKAQTGSGKTLAFVLPIFHKLMRENKFKLIENQDYLL
ncbi:DEAD/DEAH box helicase family protein [Candida albicans]|uniref:ATP-dependent RNA helicase n=1 Tax=Candida albicans TaxID=5476 RepID=A0A8H6F640_CANAX|nr:DEAD/DEAH box helicase family protein [Candida albicans]